MLGLSHQDGAGDGQVGLAGDQGSTTEVGGGANALEDRGEGDEGGRPEEIKKFGTKKDYLGKDIDGNKELSNTKMDKEPVSQTFKGGSPLDISSFMKKFGKDQEIIQESLKKYVEDNLEIEKSVKFLNEDILK